MEVEEDELEDSPLGSLSMLEGTLVEGELSSTEVGLLTEEDPSTTSEEEMIDDSSLKEESFEEEELSPKEQETIEKAAPSNKSLMGWNDDFIG